MRPKHEWVFASDLAIYGGDLGIPDWLKLKFTRAIATLHSSLDLLISSFDLSNPIPLDGKSRRGPAPQIHLG